jgi:hypothetical protein
MELIQTQQQAEAPRVRYALREFASIVLTRYECFCTLARPRLLVGSSRELRVKATISHLP